MRGKKIREIVLKLVYPLFFLVASIYRHMKHMLQRGDGEATHYLMHAFTRKKVKWLPTNLWIHNIHL